MRNEALREYADPKAMFADLAHDPQGIAYGPLGAMPAGFKVVAISPMRGEPAVLPTSQTLRARSYPLAKPIYLYFTIDTPSGQLASPRVAPKIKAFVSYILSPAGQAAVQRDGHYLPLTSAQAARQTAVLLSTSPPPERPL
jgi:phosphate transport system substrate-binding protein